MLLFAAIPPHALVMKGLLSAGTSPSPGHLHLGRPTRIRHVPSPLGEWTRIAFLGALLAALWLMVFHEPSGDPVASDLPPLVEVKTPLPQIDQDLLRQVDDGTTVARIQVEAGPFLHLLETSLNIVPAVARALGMPAEPIPIPVLRSEASRFRGRYIWYRGVLEEAPRARTGHAVKGYDIYEARLRTPDGAQVLCVFSLPPDPSLREGAWVRMEGFFFKLRDMHLPVELDRAPMLIGPELLPAFDDWKPVKALDPAVLAQVRAGKLRDGVGDDGAKYRTLVEDGGESTLSIDRSQALPLWHVASYAIEQARGRTYDQANSVPRFLTQPQWRDFVFGSSQVGATISVVGSLQAARTIEARLNPVGIEHWTEAWIQVRELAGRLLPIWIPGRLEGWKPGDPALFVGHFFKLMRYTSTDDVEHIAPLFVVPELMRYRLPDNPFATYYMVPVLVAFVGLMFFTIWYVRRDRRRELLAEADLVERRRRRRATAGEPAASSLPGSSTTPADG